MVVPSVIEPTCQFLRGVVIQNVDVKFPLVGESGESEVAAPEVADNRVDRVRTEKQVEFGVEMVFDKEFDYDLLRPDLMGETAESSFILLSRGTNAELVAKFLGQHTLQPQSRGIVHVRRSGRETEGGAKISGRECLHTDEEAAAIPFTAAPLLDVVVKLLPAAHVEVADAKVGACADCKCVL